MRKRLSVARMWMTTSGLARRNGRCRINRDRESTYSTTVPWVEGRGRT